MKRWGPDKITALILICGCLALIASGKDSEVKSILTVASGYLFGTSLWERKINQQQKQKEEVK